MTRGWALSPGRCAIARCRVKRRGRQRCSLDESAEMPAALQANLRLFPPGQTVPNGVGEPGPRKADVRIVAATNRYLDAPYGPVNSAKTCSPPQRLRADRTGPCAIAPPTRSPGLSQKEARRLFFRLLLLPMWPGADGPPGCRPSRSACCSPIPGLQRRDLRNAIARAVILSAGHCSRRRLFPERNRSSTQ